MGYACIAFTILLTIYGQLVLYWRVSGRGLALGLQRAELMNIVRAILDPWVLSGFAAAFLASVGYLIALSRFQINHAYPFMSLTFPLVAICAHFLFGDALPARKLLGLALVVCGLIIGSQATGGQARTDPQPTKEVSS